MYGSCQFADEQFVENQERQVLLIEDNPGDARLVEEFFHEDAASEFQVHWADRLSKGIDRLQQGGIDLVLLDLSLPDSRGLSTFTKVRSHVPNVPVILLTGNDDESLSIQAVRQGAQDYIVKGHADGTALVRSARYAIERHGAQLERLQESHRTKGKVIGFLGAKGGVGVTTVALNVASALASPERAVIAAELRPDLGAFIWHTRETNPKSLSALLELDAESIDEKAVSACLQRVRPGLRLLYGPQGDSLPEIPRQKAASVVEGLSYQAAVTVLDLPSHLSTDSFESVRLCDFVIVVVEPEAVCLMAAKRKVERLEAAGVSRSHYGAVVVKRAAVTNPIPLLAVKVHLNCMIVGMIPPAPEECSTAAETGIPIVAGSPDSLVAASLVQLAERLAADPVTQMWIG